MQIRLIILLSLVIVQFSVQAQKGITKYTLSPGDSRPVYYLVHDSIMYFSAQNTSLFSIDLWMMDGTTPKVKGKGNDGGPFPYHYIVGGRGDSLFLLVIDIGLGIFSNGLYAYDLAKDTLLMITPHTNIAIGGAVMKDSSYIIYNADTQVHRYNIATGQKDVLIHKCDTAVYSIHRAHNNYYVSCRYSVGTGYHYDLHILDTVNKSIFTQTLVPNSTGGILYSKPVQNGNDIYFFGSDAQHGAELYKYSGSGLAQRVTDIRQGSANSISDYYLVAYNNRIYFAAGDGKARESLFEYNPVSGTTKLIYEMNTTNPNENFQPQHYYVYNKRLYMSGNEQASLNIFLTQPFVYDGADTPMRLAVLCPPNTGIQNRTYPKFFTEYNGDLYFTSYDSLDNIEMFRYNDSGLRSIPLQNIIETTTPFFSILYPNPTIQDAYLDIHLDKAQTFSVQLTDIQGRIVYKNEVKLYSQGQHKLTIPMQQLAAGTYVYRISDGNDGLLNSGKLLKQ